MRRAVLQLLTARSITPETLAKEYANAAQVIEQRYDLTPRTASGVMMSRGKPVPMGPTAKLKNRLTFDALG